MCVVSYCEPKTRKSSQMSIPTSDLDRVTRLLRTYFDNDQLKRFDLERYAGNGANALTWKIKYKPRRGAALERIVLKMERLVAFFDENAPDPKSAPPTPPDDDAMDVDADMWNNPIKNEEKWLKVREPSSLDSKGRRAC